MAVVASAVAITARTTSVTNETTAAPVTSATTAAALATSSRACSSTRCPWVAVEAVASRSSLEAAVVMVVAMAARTISSSRRPIGGAVKCMEGSGVFLPMIEIYGEDRHDSFVPFL